jgi:hypothetical protein
MKDNDIRTGMGKIKAHTILVTKSSREETTRYTYTQTGE